MTFPVLPSNNVGGYLIQRSLRFRSSASAYLSRTPSVAGNRKTWTWSGWVKRGALSVTQNIFDAAESGTSNPRTDINFDGNNIFNVQFNPTGSAWITLSSAQVFRDPSAWYHIIIAVDTTQATNTNRVKVYVNGSQITMSGSYPNQNTDLPINNTWAHSIGRYQAGASQYLDGYLTEINFIDGQALTPSSFGQTDPVTGVWQPKKYTGTYGTNGFYLPFTDNSGATATTIGKDFSGNSNNWTPNNITLSRYASFTTVGTTSWTAPAGVTSVNYLIVGGGGGGGNGYNGGGGGGGGGGVLTGTLSVTPGNSYTVTVGTGGAVNTNGGSSVFATLTALGGGAGGNGTGASGSSGGSGGGGSAGASPGVYGAGGAGTSGQGNAGGAGNVGTSSNWMGGGGGGAGAPGSQPSTAQLTGGAGGNGVLSTITGLYYGGGGGGGCSNGAYSTGGLGGGGTGYIGLGTAGTNGLGGGGGAYAAGGSGTVILSYEGAPSLATYDSMTDVPTLTSATAANYCVINPIDYYSVSGAPTITEGNLKAVTTANGNDVIRSSMGVSSGKWYWEVTLVSGTNNALMVQVSDITVPISSATYTGANAWGYYGNNGNKFTNNTGSAYGASFTANDVIGVALDMDAGTLTFYKNGTSQGQAFSGLTGKTLTPSFATGGAAMTCYFNAGQRPFSYTPPSGFKALNTFNLPDATIKKGSTNFNVVLDTGANIKTTAEAVYPSNYFEWIKDRANANNHQLIDVVRGSTAVLQSNTTGAETTYSAPTGNSVAWVWNAGGSTVTNTSGSISSQVRANPNAGFSIVTYTGTGANATVGHGLGVAPKMIIIKRRNTVSNWVVWHGTFSGLQYLNLDSTNSVGSLASVWNSTVPTSSVFNLGTDAAVNGSGGTYVAYCFSEVAGFSRFGSYTGNGSADGPFVYCGFRPKFILVKRTDAAGDGWVIYDTARNTYNLANSSLAANSSGAEVSPDTNNAYDLLSNGFKARLATGSATNASGGTYIYMAFAENPFKNSLAR